MDLLYFVLLISTLIFVHELGHFAFAKIFGVKVITFSLGFGPKILKIRGKETEYCIGILPLGGFVKMLEEAKGTETVLPEDKTRTFESMALWKRIVIVLAGPAMNVLFPIVLYTSVYLEDRQLLPATVGAVIPGRPADGRLLPGDVLLAIDGDAISTFPEVQRAVGARAGRPVRFSVQRDGRPVDVTVTPDDEIERAEPMELDIVEHVGRIGVTPTFEAPVIGVSRPESPAGRAGLQSFDRITAINGRKVERFIELVAALAQNKGDTVALSYLRPVPVPLAGGFCEIAVMEPGIAQITPIGRPEAHAADDEAAREKDVLARTGLESSDMYVAYVPEKSGEWQAGLRVGDRIVTLDGVPQRMWKAFKDQMRAGGDRAHRLEWTRAGEAKAGTFQNRSEFRSTHWAPKAPDTLVPNPHLLWHALRGGIEETGRALRFTTVGILRLVQGKTSLSNVSGLITIYDVAGQAGAAGATNFVWAMALISVNLGLINLLPIPVLDGGHLFFFLVEGIRRRPIPLRAREIASLVGVSVLVVLMLIAFKNDIERRNWDDIRAQLHEIFG
jgi:regulator of sigma E protease